MTILGFYNGVLDLTEASVERLAATGAAFHYRLRARDPAISFRLADELWARGIRFGLWPRRDRNRWEAAEAREDFAALAPLAAHAGLATVDLAHEQFRFATPEMRSEMVHLARQFFPGAEPVLHYGGASILTQSRSQLGGDPPHVVHIGANQGDGSDVEVWLRAAERLVLILQADRDELERRCTLRHRLMIHVNVRPDTPADQTRRLLLTAARVRPDWLLLRTAGEGGGGDAPGPSVLEGFREAAIMLKK